MKRHSHPVANGARGLPGGLGWRAVGVPAPGRRNLIVLGCDFVNNRIPWRPRRRTPLYVLYQRLESESRHGD